MIVFQLICAAEHRFDAWFRDGATFDRLNAADGVECPFCGSAQVAKAPMAPHIARTSVRENDPERRARELAGEILEAMETVRQRVEETCDDVGEAFPEEARRIHYGEAEKRGIYGEASDEEAAALDEEGIEIGRLPFVRRRHQ